MGSFTIVYTTFLPKHLCLVLKSIDLLHKYFGVATNIFKSFTQRQGSALGRQRRGRVPRLVATAAQRRNEVFENHYFCKKSHKRSLEIMKLSHPN
jgi:hypothetical protein